MRMRVLNTTPHDVTATNVLTGHTQTFPKNPAWATRGGWTPGAVVDDVCGIPTVANGVFHQEPLTIDLEDDDVLIVSMVTGNCVEAMTPERFAEVFRGKRVRVVSPGSGPHNSTRDESGKILASLQFVEYFPKGQ